MTTASKPRAAAAQAAPGLEDLLCFSVYSAGHAFTALYRPLLAELGLTYPQYLVMRLLWARDDQSVKEIGQALRLESNTLTPLLKRLEALELVARRRDAEDERVVRISLTAQGAAMRARAAEVPNCVAEATGMSERELGALIRSVNELRDRLLTAAGEG